MFPIVFHDSLHSPWRLHEGIEVLHAENEGFITEVKVSSSEMKVSLRKMKVSFFRNEGFIYEGSIYEGFINEGFINEGFIGK